MIGGASLRADVHVPGEPVRRDVEVRLEGRDLQVGDRALALEEILWTDRRAGLLLVFTMERGVALRAEGALLDDMADAVAVHVSETDARRRLSERLEGRNLRLVAGCAVVGRVGGRTVHGLRVAVLSGEGLHLVGAGETLGLEWPVEAVEVVQGRGGRRALRLRMGDDVVALHYLERDEEEAIREAASETEGASRAGSLEMFRQKDVAPPPPAEIPELSVAAESLAATAKEAAGRVPDDLRDDAGLRPHFLETHFLELGEIALGPLLLRKSAASGARSLERAVEALDAGELQDDTRAAVSRAVRRLTEVYDQELERLRGERNVARSSLEGRALDPDELDRLTARVQAPFDQLAPRFRELEEAQESLRVRLEELAEGPPRGDDAGVDRAAEAWRVELRRLDRGFREAWKEALEELRRAWGSLLLPRLTEMADVRRRRIPEWARLVLLGILTFLAVGGAVLLLGG
jgi:hypothetical protein